MSHHPVCPTAGLDAVEDTRHLMANWKVFLAASTPRWPPCWWWWWCSWPSWRTPWRGRSWDRGRPWLPEHLWPPTPPGRDWGQQVTWARRRRQWLAHPSPCSHPCSNPHSLGKKHTIQLHLPHVFNTINKNIIDVKDPSFSFFFKLYTR